jgi:hypothetical protein
VLVAELGGSEPRRGVVRRRRCCCCWDSPLPLMGVAQRLPGCEVGKSTHTAAIRLEAGPTCGGGSGTEGRAEDEAECTEEATDEVRS